MKLSASIDIGSNSLLLLAGYFDDKGVFQESLNLCEVTGLGSGIDTLKAFAPESMAATRDVLGEYHDKIKALGIRPEDVIITATEASRVSQNAPEFFAAIQKEWGFKVQIITAQGEAYYSSLGVYLGLGTGKDSGTWKNRGDFFTLDVGGASTEIIQTQMTPFQNKDFLSLPLGSVRGRDWQEKGLLEKEVQRILQDHQPSLEKFKTKTLICIAGTMTSVANMILQRPQYNDHDVHGVSFSSREFTRLLQHLQGESLEDLQKSFPFLGKRARTLYAGAYVAFQLGEALGVKEYVISIYGARYGTLFEGGVKDEFIYRTGGKRE